MKGRPFMRFGKLPIDGHFDSYNRNFCQTY